MKRTCIHRVAALLLSCVFLAGLLPTAVSAATFDGDFTTVDSEIFDWYSSGLPTEDLLYQAGDGTVAWNAATKTMTFDNASITYDSLSSNGGVQLPSSGGEQVTVVLKGANVFTDLGGYSSAAFFHAYGNSLTISGDGTLTTTGSDRFVSVGVGGSVIFNHTGTIETTVKSAGLYVQGPITMNSGTLRITTTGTNNTRGIFLYGADCSLTVTDGELDIEVMAEGIASGGIYDNSFNTVSLHGGSVTVNAQRTAVYVKDSLIVDQSAKLEASSVAENAVSGVGKVYIRDNAQVTATSEQSGALTAREISGNATVTANGYYYGLAGCSLGFTLSGSPTIVASGETAMSNLGSVSLTGYVLTVGTAQDGSGAAIWDRTSPLSGYAYVRLETCMHQNAADDGDCTTALVCPDCETELVGAQAGHQLGDWQSNETGHWHACENDDCSYAETVTPHSATDDGDCTTALVCECGYVLQAAQTSHTLGGWQSNGEEHWKACQQDGCNHTEQRGQHTGGTVTCTEDAVCETCQATYGEATGHAYGEPEFDWSEDGKSCTVTFTCEHDATHVQPVTADVTSTVKSGATCTQAGVTTYTATATLENKTYTDTKEVADIPATGHVETELRGAKEATCTEEGYTGDRVCQECDTVVEAGTVIPKREHRYENGVCTVCGTADPTYQPTEPEGGDPDSPDTGDNGRLALWIVLALVSCVGACGAVAFGKRRRQTASR